MLKQAYNSICECVCVCVCVSSSWLLIIGANMVTHGTEGQYTKLQCALTGNTSPLSLASTAQLNSLRAVIT